MFRNKKYTQSQSQYDYKFTSRCTNIRICFLLFARFVIDWLID